jgi:predicted nucleic acid-binding protein
LITQVDGYLLDTCAISAYWDPGHPCHPAIKGVVDAIPSGSPRFVSRITLAEIEFGILLDEAERGSKSARATAVLNKAHGYPIREITRHTGHEYAELRKKIAATYLAKSIRSNRPRWIEQWVDRITEERLQIDENDLWICAQARESNLILITTDKKMVNRVSRADSAIQFQLVQKP